VYRGECQGRFCSPVFAWLPGIPARHSFPLISAYRKTRIHLSSARPARFTAAGNSSLQSGARERNVPPQYADESARLYHRDAKGRSGIRCDAVEQDAAGEYRKGNSA